ncbi:MAG: 1,4-dihydroxy-2-naphthoate polyprenyltransferase, partial [Nocardioides sp.]
VGKRTLAVVLGDEQTRYLFAFLVAVAAILLLGVALETGPFAMLGLAYLATAYPATRLVLGGAEGRALIPVLQKVGVAEILYAAGIFLGIAFA